MRFIQKQLIAVLLTVFTLVSTHSAWAAKGRYALVIGNGDYRAADNLGNPVQDARAVRKAFERLGFKVIYGENLTRNQNVKKIREFLGRKDKMEVAAFFYAGHGIQINGENYIVPVDADIRGKTNLSDNIISMNRLLSYMDRHSKTSLIFLDACRDNPFSEQIVSGMNSGTIQRTRNLGRFNLALGKAHRAGNPPRRAHEQRKRAHKSGAKGPKHLKRRHKGRHAVAPSARKKHNRPRHGAGKHRRTKAAPARSQRVAAFGPARTSNADQPINFSARPLVVGKGLAEIGGKTGMFVAFATAPGNVAFDGAGKHSPFTEGLLKHIDENVEINLVATRIRNHVNTITKGLQVPWSSSSLTSEIYLARLPRDLERPRVRLKPRKRPKLRKRAKPRPSKKVTTKSKSRKKKSKTTRRKPSTKKKTVRKTTKKRTTRTTSKKRTVKKKTARTSSRKSSGSSPVFLP